MLTGSNIIGRVIKESVCRNTEDYYFTDIGDYRIHSTSLMPNIPFGKSSILPYEIDDSIFVNDEDTRIYFEPNIKCQNFLTTKYIGRAPLEFYGPKTKMGREFVLICRDNNPEYQYRCFGTESAIRSWNKNANDNSILPK